MRLWIALLAAVPACGFSGPSLIDRGDGGTDADAPFDGPPCYGSYARTCFSAVPSGSFDVTGIRNINTSLGALTMDCDLAVTDYCVIAHATITINAGATLRAFGTRPLVLIAATTFNLMGDIDVSSSQDGLLLGAGAFLTVCEGTIPATETSGGFGGTFGGRGGEGEQVDGDRGRPAAAAGTPTKLRGGCPGGAGGPGAAGGGGAVGGFGGGAVAIIATELRFSGKINASGAGGRGGAAIRSGGGGGGSGGMIVLDMPESAIMRNGGVLFANGGGGGEGGAGANPGAGAGEQGQISMAPNAPGAGGTSSKAGGNGGAGSASSIRAGADAAGQSDNDGGGGGGGGGAGVIHAPGITGDSVVAPPPTTLPMNPP